MNRDNVLMVAEKYLVGGVYRDYYRLDKDDIHAFAQAIEAQVREECARVCENRLTITRWGSSRFRAGNW